MSARILLLSLTLLFVFSQCRTSHESERYIVYLGSSALPRNKLKQSQLIESLQKRNGNNSVTRSYQHGFLGFAAKMSENEARKMARHSEVISVFPDPVLQLHTTRSWDFLGDQASSTSSMSHTCRPVRKNSTLVSDIIIGIIDTGIWPESKSFNDEGLGPVPSRWKGTCMKGVNFNSSNCNRKLIGARYYKGYLMESPRDEDGHGTHVVSIASGNCVPKASYYGLASGTAKGGSATSRIAMYRVCDAYGCHGSAILSAFDDAISDGVEIISISIGSSLQPELYEDPIAIGAFHAIEKGITVVASAGNEGPYQESVQNVAPWILTVAATTIDRQFGSQIILGNNHTILGGSLNFSNISKLAVYPLVLGGSGTDRSSRYCNPSMIASIQVNGSIVVCEVIGTDREPIRLIKTYVKAGKGVGLIIINDPLRLDVVSTGTFPLTVITSKQASTIFHYMKSTRNPVATISATITVHHFRPAPTIGPFSSRGPSYSTKNILKPDVGAPGVNILASWISNDTRSEDTAPPGKKPQLFNIMSGTSMACPHVSGIAANIKKQNPSWSPAAIRSAIMTTARQTDNLHRPISSESGEVATPYDYGSGHVSLTGGQHPGLIYDLNHEDYLLFLCHYGYNLSTIRLISSHLPKGFSCPKNSRVHMISDINYPSIAISKNVARTPVTVKRTITNVDSIDNETIYTVIIDAPEGLEVNVVPRKLWFTRETKRLSYHVTFSASSNSAVKGDLFGAVTWVNGKHTVRIPFIVNNS